MVVAHEFDVFKLLFYLLFDRNEFRLLAHHWTLSGLFGEFIKADLMETIVTLLTFPWFYQNSLTECA